jgi:hypothetical protein
MLRFRALCCGAREESVRRFCGTVSATRAHSTVAIPGFERAQIKEEFTDAIDACPLTSAEAELPVRACV